MVRDYAHVGDLWAYYNPEEAANQDRLTDEELNVAKNLFALMWSRRPGEKHRRMDPGFHTVPIRTSWRSVFLDTS